MMNDVTQEKSGVFAVLNTKDETIQPGAFNSMQLKLIKSSTETFYVCAFSLVYLEVEKRHFLEHCDSNHVLIGFVQDSLRVKLLVSRNVICKTCRTVNSFQGHGESKDVQ